MDIQTITVAAIVIICMIYAGKSIYNMITGKKKTSCDSCDGCALKDKTYSCTKKGSYR